MASVDNLVAVTVYIDPSHLASLSPSFPGATAPAQQDQDSWPLQPREARALDIWSLPGWRLEDLDRAIWLLEDLGNKTQGLVAAMTRHADDGASGDELAAESGYGNGAKGVRSALRAVGLRCRQVNRTVFWDPNRSRSRRANYRMDAAARDLFEAALDRVRPAWRDE